jgi:hypothetical protein
VVTCCCVNDGGPRLSDADEDLEPVLVSKEAQCVKLRSLSDNRAFVEF